MRKRSPDEVGIIFMIVQRHLDESTLLPLAERVAMAQTHRDLAANAEAADKARRALTAVCRFHTAAASRKWYSKRVANGQVLGPARRPWARYPRFYRRVINVLDADPALRFATSTGFPRGRSGNPVTMRNGALAAQLLVEGVSKEQASRILVAIAFKRPDQSITPKKKN
jgi:hypothetical protein